MPVPERVAKHEEGAILPACSCNVVLAKRLQGLSPPDVKYMYKCASCIFKIMQPLSGGDPQSTRTLAQRCVGRKL